MQCLSVCPSVTFMDNVKTNKHYLEIFSPSGSHTILVFPYQRGCRYSDGNTPNGGVKCKGGMIQEAQLSLTNRAMPVCKVVEVLQDFLSEYVDKKFTKDYSVTLYLSIFNSFRVIRCLSQCVSPKISIFTTFLFPLGTPCAKRCMKEKISQCLPNPSQHVPMYLQQFPS